MSPLLEGVTVLELADGVAGATCGRSLHDLGARVIKIEAPDGDWLAALSPDGVETGAMYRQLNEGKDIRRLDLKDADGRAEMLSHLADADICVIGHRRASWPDLGIDVAAFHAADPALVFCHISGWGSEGPYADLPVTELGIQAAAGLTRFLGSPGQPPVRQGFDLVSVATGLAAAQASLAALFWADRTAHGQEVEVSMLATAVALQQWDVAAESGPDAWEGTQLDATDWPPDRGFRCADAQCRIDMRSHEEDWPSLLRDIGCADLAADPRFSTRDALDLHDRELPALTEAALSRWTFSDLERLVRDTYGGTVVPMLDLRAALDHPQVRHLGLLGQGPAPRIGFPVEIVEAG